MRILVIGGAGYIGSHVVKAMPDIRLRYLTIYLRDSFAILSRVRSLSQAILGTPTTSTWPLPAGLTAPYTWLHLKR